MKIKRQTLIFSNVLLILSAILGVTATSVMATVCSIDPDGTVIEAENFNGSSNTSRDNDKNFSIVEDGNASNSKVLVAGRDGSAGYYPTMEIKTYTVNFPEGGDYYFWVRGYGKDSGSDSAYFTVGNGSWNAWNLDDGLTYKWTDNEQFGSNKITVSAGEQTIKIGMRESNAHIDAFFITNDSGTSPSFDYGVDPNNCSETGSGLSSESGGCGDIPLYSQDLLDPAIMVQLDLSGSMGTQMYSNEKYITSDLAAVIQEVIDLEEWTSGNAIGFKISGTGYRSAYSYEGSSADAPLLTITYRDADSGEEITISQRISAGSHDVQVYDNNFYTNYNDYGRLYPGERGPVGLYFESITIPADSEIVTADIEFEYRDSSQDNLSDVSMLNVQAFKIGNLELADITQTSLTSDAGFSLTESSLSYTRLDYAVAVLKEIFQDEAIAWGFATWSGGSGWSSDYDSSGDNYTDYKVGVRVYSEEHEENLLSKLSDTTASGYTPFVPSMNAAYDYFVGNRDDETYNEEFEPESCQARILVNVTDGIGNTGSDVTKAGAATTKLTNEGISVVAVGFGIDDASQLNRVADYAQSAGEVSDADKLYPLHNVDGDGDGVPYLANSPDEFLDAMKSIISSVKLQMYYGVAPAPTTTTEDENYLITATFNPSKWTGDLTANTFDEDTGIVGEVIWQASEVYEDNGSPTSATSYIHTASGVETYDDSDLVNDNYMCKDCGDIINSMPKIVPTPSYFYTFDSYNNFKYDEVVTARDTIAYVNSNDGALHAYLLAKGSGRSDTDTTPLGKELWRFYPATVTDLIDQDLCSAGYCHQYINDGSPQVADVYVEISGTWQWRTLLTSGIGKGGGGYFALDITYGNDFSSATNPASLLWEFDDSDEAELGLATSDVEVDRFANNRDAGTSATWASIFGSGRAIDSSNQDAKYAYVFAVDSWDKSAIWQDSGDNDIYKIQIGTDDPDNTDQKLGNDIPSPPLTVDLNDDALVDLIYVGNRYGELFAIEDVGEGETPNVRQLYTSGLTDHTSPFVAKPAFAYGENDTAWIYAGTGKYDVSADKISSDQQYLFGLNDSGSTLYDIGDLTTCTVGSVVSDTDGDGQDEEYRTVSCTIGTSDSWVLKLENPSTSASERALSQPLVVGGVVFFTTFVPDDDVCGGSGDAYLYAVDWLTGQAPDEQVLVDYPGEVDGEKVAGVHIGKGVPFQPVLHDDILFVGTTEQPPDPVIVNLEALKATLKSWKQKYN